MYLQVTYLPGSVASQSATHLAVPKLLTKMNEEMKYDPPSGPATLAHQVYSEWH